MSNFRMESLSLCIRSQNMHLLWTVLACKGGNEVMTRHHVPAEIVHLGLNWLRRHFDPETRIRSRNG